jgi:hypothetical protein
MTVATKGPRRATRTPSRKIPDYLIYEIMDGKPIYYRGYRDVLAGRKTLEEIRGRGSLPALIVSYLAGFIGNVHDETRFLFLLASRAFTSTTATTSRTTWPSTTKRC